MSKRTRFAQTAGESFKTFEAQYAFKTITGASGSVVATNAEDTLQIVLATGLNISWSAALRRLTWSLSATVRTVCFPFYVDAPVVQTAPDAHMIGFCQYAETVVAVIAQTDAGTVSFNIEKRAQTSPFVAGTDIDAAEFTATAAGIDDTTISAASVSANYWLFLHISAIASSPTKLIGCVVTTKD